MIARLALVPTLLLGTTLAVAREEPAPRPRGVVLILADDMGSDSVSALHPTSGLATPSLDKLAAQGMCFTDAHSGSGVCSPTRYGLLTGRYAWRTRLKQGIVAKWGPPLIDDEELTLAEVMQAADYVTACIGKWHLGWNWPRLAGATAEDAIDYSRPVTGGPTEHGFDTYFGDDVPNWPPYTWIENDRVLVAPTGRMEADSANGVSAGPAVPGWKLEEVLPTLVDRCEAFLAERAEAEEPFFLFFSMTSPHTPINPTKEFRGKSGVSAYADFLLETDWAVGRVLATLDRLDLADDTLVIFTADNGTSPKARFAELEAGGILLRETWRGHKADAFEGGHRVPFIVRWPGVVEAGARCSEIISLVDCTATLAEVVGATLPPDAAVDSVSLLPLLRGETLKAPLHEAVVSHSSGGRFAVHRGQYKAIFCPGSGGWSAPNDKQARARGLPEVQLYNLERDPRESKNLCAEQPEVVEELRGILRRFVERGRSTPGPSQSNDGPVHWRQLPWPKPGP